VRFQRKKEKNILDQPSLANIPEFANEDDHGFTVQLKNRRLTVRQKKIQ